MSINNKKQNMAVVFFFVAIIVRMANRWTIRSLLNIVKPATKTFENKFNFNIRADYIYWYCLLPIVLIISPITNMVQFHLDRRILTCVSQSGGKFYSIACKIQSMN